jgi:transcriptional antiterminator NusG
VINLSSSIETADGRTVSPQSSTQRAAIEKWFALRVNVRHEKVVSLSLEHKGFETFLPTYECRHQYARRFRAFELPLFPGYVFCLSDPQKCLPILTTPGVLQMVGAGRTPIPVDEDEIRALKKAMQAGFHLMPYPLWQAGQKARIISGPLAGVEGIVVSEKRATARLVLSVDLLQRSVMLEIDSNHVELTADGHSSIYVHTLRDSTR